VHRGTRWTGSAEPRWQKFDRTNDVGNGQVNWGTRPTEIYKEWHGSTSTP